MDTGSIDSPTDGGEPDSASVSIPSQSNRPGPAPRNQRPRRADHREIDRRDPERVGRCANGPPLLLAVAFEPNPKHQATANGSSGAAPLGATEAFTDMNMKQLENLSYSIDQMNHIVEFTYMGSPSFEEWVLMMYAILNDQSFQPGYGFLSDRRGITDLPTTEYVRSVIDFLQGHCTVIGARRWAILVSGTASYGMARMAQQFGHELPFPIEVFTDEAKARRWLSAGRDEELAVR